MTDPDRATAGALIAGADAGTKSFGTKSAAAAAAGTINDAAAGTTTDAAGAAEPPADADGSNDTPPATGSGACDGETGSTAADGAPADGPPTESDVGAGADGAETSEDCTGEVLADRDSREARPAAEAPLRRTAPDDSPAVSFPALLAAPPVLSVESTDPRDT